MDLARFEVLFLALRLAFRTLSNYAYIIMWVYPMSTLQQVNNNLVAYLSLLDQPLCVKVRISSLGSDVVTDAIKTRGYTCEGEDIELSSAVLLGDGKAELVLDGLLVSGAVFRIVIFAYLTNTFVYRSTGTKQKDPQNQRSSSSSSV